MSAPSPQTIAMHYIPVRKDWLERRTEEILEPDLPIVDPHHHLWDRPNNRYLLDELLADTNAGHNIVATVFVQCRAFHRADGDEALKPVGETEFVTGVAAMSESGAYGNTRICEGIVGNADLTMGAEVGRVLDAHVKAAGGRFRGIRHIVTWSEDKVLMNPNYAPPPHQLDDEKFREGIRQLGRHGLTFDAWLYHPQISELTAAARACPDTQIVLDHCGGPLGASTYKGKRESEFPGWAASIKELATCPNVHVKLGGLGMRINGFHHEDETDPPSSEMLAETWKPYFDTCIEAFGTSRCMFESNFPVDKGSYSYQVYWNACKRYAAGMSV
ncbi:MAG: amidohydrolase family protein, partial [Alphaproteobacteria bacterium]|nr:amidohydrolase family protein [Alphaproteobacteria bacterium]